MDGWLISSGRTKPLQFHIPFVPSMVKFHDFVFPLAFSLHDDEDNDDDDDDDALDDDDASLYVCLCSVVSIPVCYRRRLKNTSRSVNQSLSK